MEGRGLSPSGDLFFQRNWGDGARLLSSIFGTRHRVTVDGKRNSSILLWREGDVYCDGMCRITDQRACPHDVAEVEDTWQFCRMNVEGLSHGYIYHLQICHPWHNPLSLDYMIGQEKLFTVKGRAEPLFPQSGGIALHQW